jgi:hypothetical protein
MRSDEMAGSGAAARALRVGPVFWTWLVAVGVDLFFNAGVFAGLFEQSREPSLLADAILFARIPIAYLVVAVGVTAVAWVLDVARISGARRGVVVGATIGLVFGLTGVVWLWTAMEMTVAFVGAGVLVQVAQMAAAGTVLGAVRSGLSPRQLRWRSAGTALVLAIAAVVVQNAIG